jgi:hypothetical protein
MPGCWLRRLPVCDCGSRLPAAAAGSEPAARLAADHLADHLIMDRPTADGRGQQPASPIPRRPRRGLASAAGGSSGKHG